jgi:hypothetical protein
MDRVKVGLGIDIFTASLQIVISATHPLPALPLGGGAILCIFTGK